MSREGSNAKPNRATIALCVISLSLAACGIYLHHRAIDNVIAIAWSSKGRPVQLVQEVSFAWSFIGAAPHVVDPHTVRGPLALVAERHARTALAGYGDEWDFNWALARSQGRGFVVGISRTRASGNRDNVCLLIDLSGQVTKCPRGVPAGELHVFMAPQSDRVVFQSRPRGEIHGIDLTDGARSVVDKPVWLVRFEGKKHPCEMSYSALAPDEHAWVVACQTGLWTVNGSDPPTLLLSFETGAASLPPVIVTGMENGARPFWQEFGLAWSPDARRIYYCGWKEDTGVLIDVPNRTSRTALSCVTGAMWSPDGRRIIGVTGKGELGEVVVQ